MIGFADERLGSRQDYERLAAKYKLISLEVRKSLKNKFKNEGGSPSKVLMSQLQTMHPNHPVRCLVRMLKEIGRKKGEVREIMVGHSVIRQMT